MSFESGSSNFVQDTDIAWTSKVPATATTQAYYSTKVLDYCSEIKPVSSVDRATTLEAWSVSSSGVIEAKYSNGDAITVYLDENDKAYKYQKIRASFCIFFYHLLLPVKKSRCVISGSGILFMITVLWQFRPKP
mgnify:CR=1 FL=1